MFRFCLVGGTNPREGNSPRFRPGAAALGHRRQGKAGLGSHEILEDGHQGLAASRLLQPWHILQLRGTVRVGGQARIDHEGNAPAFQLTGNPQGGAVLEHDVQHRKVRGGVLQPPQSLRIAHEGACHLEARLFQGRFQRHPDQRLIFHDHAARLSHHVRFPALTHKRSLARGGWQSSRPGGQETYPPTRPSYPAPGEASFTHVKLDHRSCFRRLYGGPLELPSRAVLLPSRGVPDREMHHAQGAACSRSSRGRARLHERPPSFT
jgi:hypothetical protein